MAGKPVRVVFVTTVFEGADTGPGTYARYLWSAFRDDPDLEFHLVAPEVSESHPRLHASGNGSGPVALYRRVQETGLRVAGSSARDTIVHGNATHSMGRFVGYPGPLLVQVNDYDVATFPRRAVSVLGQRGIRRLLGSGWRHFHERRVLKHATLAICNSVYTSESIRRAYSVPEERIRVVHKAVDTAGYRRPGNPAPDPTPARCQGTRLVFVGADWRRKGLDVPLSALQRLEPMFPGVTLTVIGPEPGDAELMKLIHERRLSEHVDVVGRQSPEMVARYLWHAQAFVLPSRREALGVAVLEAMAAGVPVIATRVGGIPEIVRSDAEGLLVQPDDREGLLLAIQRLVQDTELRRELAIAGPTRASEFSVATMTQAIKNTYLAVAARRAATA